MSKLSLPRFARVLRENGEMDIGIILAAERTQEGLVYKTFMGNPKPKVQQVSKVIEYEERKENLGEILNDTTLRVFDVKPNEIIDVFNEKLDFGKVEFEVKENFGNYSLLCKAERKTKIGYNNSISREQRKDF